eukprot:6630628-Prymnesium_polylepis.1
MSPGGGIERYAALRCLWHEIRVDERTNMWPLAYGAPCGGSGPATRALPAVPLARADVYRRDGLWCAVRRYRALRALCGA